MTALCRKAKVTSTEPTQQLSVDFTIQGARIFYRDTFYQFSHDTEALIGTIIREVEPPALIRSDGRLIAGARRLAACQNPWKVGEHFGDFVIRAGFGARTSTGPGMMNPFSWSREHLALLVSVD
jgi:hypothetical protein